MGAVEALCGGEDFVEQGVKVGGDGAVVADAGTEDGLTVMFDGGKVGVAALLEPGGDRRVKGGGSAVPGGGVEPETTGRGPLVHRSSPG